MSEQSHTAQSESGRRPAIAVGQVWRHKREPWRNITISHVYDDGAVTGRRNTSNRRQAISQHTLLRTYRLDTRS